MTNGSQALYVDGVLEDTATDTILTDTWEVVLGTRSFDSLFYKGVLDDVRVYNRVLSAAEAKQLYQLGGVRITQ